MRVSTAMASEDVVLIPTRRLLSVLQYIRTLERRATGLDMPAVGYGDIIFIVLDKDRWDRGVITAHCILSEYRYARYVTI